LGGETNITNHLIVGFEVAPRYTLADDIDGSFPTNEGLKQLHGNINSNDWYLYRFS
jgi:hypothetical protein